MDLNLKIPKIHITFHKSYKVSPLAPLKAFIKQNHTVYMQCKILIANPIDCLEYFIFFSINSSEARKQHDECCNKVSLKRSLRKLTVFRYVTGRYVRSSVIEKSLLMESS
jgi:hypothetical protein